MNEHGPFNPSYTDRPEYNEDHSLERQWQLHGNIEMLDDMLKASPQQSGVMEAEMVPGVGVKANRWFSYQNDHDEEIVFSLEYATNDARKSKSYDVTVDTYLQTTESVLETPVSTHYRLQKDGHHVTLAQIETIDLDNEQMYQSRRMTAYDAQQLTKEIIDFNINAYQQPQENS